MVNCGVLHCGDVCRVKPHERFNLVHPRRYQRQTSPQLHISQQALNCILLNGTCDALVSCSFGLILECMKSETKFENEDWILGGMPPSSVWPRTVAEDLRGRNTRAERA